MGLDITAVNKIVKTKSKDKTINLCINKGFPEQADNLKNGYYLYDQKESFRIGSYGDYNQWRDKLAQLMFKVTAQEIWEQPDKYRGKAFFELINFSDCGGVIGPKTSTKLYKDFQNNKPKTQKLLQWFQNKYKAWQAAFKLASDNGAIVFH